MEIGWMRKMQFNIRSYHRRDLESLKAITMEGFEGVSLDHATERVLEGEFAGHDWRWRKARHVDEDVAIFAEGVFVAEANGLVAGYISTRIDRDAGKGRIPNLAVAAWARREGIGRALIEHALAFFREEKLEYATIETMVSNPLGQSLYPSCGFQEVARQIHFAQRL